MFAERIPKTCSLQGVFDVGGAVADADELKMAEVTISGRGVFRVAIVKGKGSGMLTLYLQPRRG
ncbi:MAG TPA: hypothetical protein O0X92_04815 [Methanocorpusculum sp.]|nr:hypothetical protein [Methanocorpusculum sp.]